MINVERHTVTGEVNPAALMQQFKNRCEMRRLTRALEEQNRILKNAETLPAIKKGETSEPQLHGIPFLEGGREGFLNNLQILTDAGHITLVKNKFTIQATNKASAHRIVESIFINAVDMGFIQNFFFKEDGKKIRWAHITKNFNYQIPEKEPAEFSNIELFKQFDFWFNIYSADREEPMFDTRTLESLICDEFKLITALTKRKQK